MPNDIWWLSTIDSFCFISSLGPSKYLPNIFPASCSISFSKIEYDLCSPLFMLYVFFSFLIILYVVVELAVGNIVRRVLHIIREEDLTLATAGIAGLNLSAVSDDEDDNDRDGNSALSAAAVAAAARSTLRPPSLQTLLEDTPDYAAVPQTSSSGGDSEGKSKCELLLVDKYF